MSSQTAPSKSRLYFSVNFLSLNIHFRNFCLPEISNSRHGELRTISCHTLASLIRGTSSQELQELQVNLPAASS